MAREQSIRLTVNGRASMTITTNLTGGGAQ